MDLLVTDPVSGKRTGLDRTVRRVLRAMEASELPYCVIGAAALAARGLVRMTRDLDLTVFVDDGAEAIATLRSAGLQAATPIGKQDDLEPMIVFIDPATKVEVDLLITAGDPEATVIDEASRATVFGVKARVATLEQLLLLYLYSNQPKHLGDFAAIVQSKRVDLAKAQRMLSVMHPEMIPDWAARVKQAKSPPPPPPRPPRRR